MRFDNAKVCQAPYFGPRDLAFSKDVRQTLMHGKRVLIVEDSYLVAAALADVLGEQGAVILGPVSSSDAALEILREQTVDGALLDVQLSDGDCTKVAADMNERHVPFVLVTGYERSTLPMELRREPYLVKPSPYDELLEVARRTFWRTNLS